MTIHPDDDYILGHSTPEVARLIRQAAIFSRMTRRFFEDIGLAPGMKVLDVGTGAGDCALIAAEFVGPSGSVIGVDRNAPVLETARARAEARNLTNVRFVEGNFLESPADSDFDAAVGRFVLFYAPDRATALRAISGRVRPGGIVAFHEPSWTSYSVTAEPPSAFWDIQRERTIEMFGRAGLPLMSPGDFHRYFLDAGLPMPAIEVLEVSATHPHLGAFVDNRLVDLVRASLPIMAALGMDPKDVGIDTFDERLRQEIIEEKRLAFPQGFMTAWIRKPA